MIQYDFGMSVSPFYFTYRPGEKVALELFGIFSFLANLCNWNFFLLFAPPCFYVSANFGSFIWIFVWIVSLLLVRFLSVNSSVQITNCQEIICTP